MTNQFTYILINGFGWSGSSALVDIMREIKGVYVPKKEFRLIKDPHGLRDLDIQINSSIDPLNEDIAIKEFLHFIDIYSRGSRGFRPLGMSYNQDFGSSFQDISREFIDSICDYQYRGYWWYLDVYTPFIPYIIYKILRKLKLYDYQKYTSLFLSVKTEEEFIELTQVYINNIFSSFVNYNDNNFIALDQAIPANRPSWGNRYFNNSKVIVVDRDPRDVYVDLIKEKSLVGYDVAINHDVQLFVDWFRKVRKEEGKDTQYLKIQFEELVLDYHRIVGEIYDFCGFLPEHHFGKYTRFNPDVSKKNIGMWRNHAYQDEIRKIEKELKEFIYQS